MSARKAARRPKAQPQGSANPRMGATLQQVEQRANELRDLVFEIRSFLNVCSFAQTCSNNPRFDLENVAISLKVAASRVNDLLEPIEFLTWAEEEIQRCKKGRLA